MADRTLKLLLTAIAVALWGILLRPLVAPTPSRAAEAPPAFVEMRGEFAAPVVKIHPATGQLYVIDNAGYLYQIDPVTLAVKRTVRLVPRP